jgi:hypothetical protein
MGCATLFDTGNAIGFAAQQQNNSVEMTCLIRISSCRQRQPPAGSVFNIRKVELFWNSSSRGRRPPHSLKSLSITDNHDHGSLCILGPALIQRANCTSR